MKKNHLFNLLVIIAALVYVSGTAHAENRKGALSLSPHVGGYVFEGNQEINSDPVYGIGLGYNFTEHIGIEGVFDWIDTDSETLSKEPDVEVMLYRMNFIYNFTPADDFVPFLSVGAGVIEIDRDDEDRDRDLIATYGAGFKYFITKSIAARAEVRYVLDIEDEVNNNLMYTAGINFFFGGKEKVTDSDGDGVDDNLDKCPGTPAGVKVGSDGCPLDGDGDGVADYLDKCPGTPSGVAVDSRGCPLDSDGDGVADYLDKCPGTPSGVAVDSKGCPVDSDGDGVADYLDKCPGTPAGAPVDRTGCPLDSDGDGVADYLDKCPGTLKGIQVDSVGCPVPIKEKVSIELRVEFAHDSAVVKNVYHEHVQKVANFLKTYPETMAEIAGHTDSTGSEKYNLSLSQKRAVNVMNHLIDFGIDSKRMKAVGYGEARPIADNKTEAGRQKNRRVEAVISTVITR